MYSVWGHPFATLTGRTDTGSVRRTEMQYRDRNGRLLEVSGAYIDQFYQSAYTLKHSTHRTPFYFVSYSSVGVCGSPVRYRVPLRVIGGREDPKRIRYGSVRWYSVYRHFLKRRRKSPNQQ